MRGKADAAGAPEPSEITNQQRFEQSGQLADIFACIFGGLTPEQQNVWTPAGVEQLAA